MKTLLPFLPALAVLAASAPAMAKPVTPERILEAEERVTYTGELLINGRQRVHVTHAGPQQRRQAYLGPAGETVDLMVADGQLRWHYAPKSQLVRVLPIEPRLGPKQRLALLGRNYQFQVLGQARRANRPVVLTRFHPRHVGNMTHMLWVDHETGLPLAVERREQDGALVDRSEYTRIRFSPAIAEGLFRFVIPDGCRVASAMTVLARGEAEHAPPRGLTFAPKMPKALPSGYALLNWQYFKSGREVPTFAWRYHDGLSTLSLFAVDARHRAPVPKGAKIVGLKAGPGYVLSQGAERMLCWRSEDVAYTLVGHLPEDELVKVANSVI